MHCCVDASKIHEKALRITGGDEGGLKRQRAFKNLKFKEMIDDRFAIFHKQTLNNELQIQI